MKRSLGKIGAALFIYVLGAIAIMFWTAAPYPEFLRFCF